MLTIALNPRYSTSIGETNAGWEMPEEILPWDDAEMPWVTTKYHIHKVPSPNKLTD